MNQNLLCMSDTTIHPDHDWKMYLANGFGKMVGRLSGFTIKCFIHSLTKRYRSLFQLMMKHISFAIFQAMESNREARFYGGEMWLRINARLMRSVWCMTQRS